MLTVSLHGIKIHAPIGMYPEERILGNMFEIDVDVWLPDTHPWPFTDYTLIQKTVSAIFKQPGELIETFVYDIHDALRQQITKAEKIRVAIRKLHPPMEGDVAYAQVCFEQ